MEKRRVFRSHRLIALAMTAVALTGFKGASEQKGESAGVDLLTWRAELPTKGSTVQKDVFPGVNAVFFGSGVRMNANLTIKPHVDLSVIQFKLPRKNQFTIENERVEFLSGDLRTQLADLQAVQVDLEGKQTLLDASFAAHPNGGLGVSVAEHDPSRTLILSFKNHFSKRRISDNNAENAGDRDLKLQAVTMEATKIDEVKPDTDSDGAATPGETIKYTVKIKNTGNMDATGAEYADLIDANTTYVAGSLNTTPLAQNESFTVLEDTPTALSLDGVDPDGDNLTFSSTTSPTKGSIGAFTQNPPNNASVTYSPNANENGPDTFKFKVVDDDGNEEEGTADITITPVNDAPTITCGGNQTHNNTDGPAITVNGWATGITTGPADESGQTLSLIISNNNNALFSAQPTVNLTNGDLSYTLSGMAGIATVSVQVQDNGGTANSGVDLSAQCSFDVQVNGPPVAVDDPNGGLPANSTTAHPYHTAINTTLNVPDGANDLLANDALGFPVATISAFDATSTQGGTVVVNANGSFSYTPPSAIFTGTDQFTYTLQNTAGSSVGTVTVAVGLRPDAVADAFTATGNIAIEHSAGAIHANNGSGVDGGDQIDVTLVNGLLANVGSATATTATGRGGVTGFVTLNADGGFTYDPPPGYEGGDSFTYAVGNGFGNSSNATVTITVSDMAWFISNSGGGNNRGTFNDPFTSIASFNTANAGTGAVPDPKNGDHISLQRGSGAYSETDGINLRNSQELIGEAVAFNTEFTANANSISAYATFASGTMAAPVISTTGGTNHGVDLASGNTVRGLNVGNTTGFGFNGGAVGSPTINTVNVTGTGGALNISTSGSFGSAVSFNTLSSTNAAAQAINLVGVSGNLFVTSGTISNPTGTAVLVNTGSVAMTYPGSVTKNNAGRLIEITNKTGGAITFSGALSNSAAGATGINVSNNTSSPVTFSGTSKVLNTGANIAVTVTGNATTTVTFSNGGLDIDATSGTGFSATSNTFGALNVSGNGNSILTTTGTALNVTSTTINPGLTFESISAGTGASGPANAIVLNTTGSNGGLTVTGDGGGVTQGGNASGGTIQNTTGDAIDVDDSRALSLTDMNILDPGGDAIDMDEVDGTCLLDQLTITDVDNAGTSAIVAHNFTGTMGLNLTIDNSFFNNSTTGQSLVLVQFRGNIGTTTVNVEDSRWNNNDPASFQIDAYEGSGTQTSGTLNHNFTNNLIENSTAVGTGDTNHSNGGSVVATFVISNNTYRDLAKAGNFNAGLLNAGYGASTVSGGTSLDLTISGNSLSATNASSIDHRRGINIVNEQSTTVTSMDLLIDNNTIDDIGNREALYISNRSTVTTFDVTITRNDFGTGAISGTTANNIGGTRDGVFIENRSGTMNLLIGGSVANGNDIRSDNTGNANSGDQIMEVESDDTSIINATVTNNNFASSSSAPVTFQTLDTASICLDLKNNTCATSANEEWVLDEASGSTIQVEGSGTGAVTEAQMQGAPHNNTGNFVFPDQTVSNNNNANCTEPN